MGTFSSPAQRARLAESASGARAGASVYEPCVRVNAYGLR